MHKTIIFIIVLLNPLFALSAEYVIALPNMYPGDTETLLSKPLNTLIGKTLSYGDTVTIYSAANLEPIAKVDIPTAGDEYQSHTYRKQKFKKELKALKSYISNLPQGTEASVNLPRFLEHLASVYHGQNAAHAPVNVLVIGNALHRDPHEPSFDMVDGYFPSDGHLDASPDQSIYGTIGKRGFLTGFRIHFMHTNRPEDWYTELYRQRIERFWTLFVMGQDGVLATFTPDAQTAFDRFYKGEGQPLRRYALDHTASKIEMLRADREGVPNRKTTASSFLEQDAPISTLPPGTTKGKLRVGIRWDCAKCDIDIYGRSNKNQPFLYFSHVRSPEGYYSKDFRTSPDAINGLEYIEFTQAVDMNDIEVLVNFYGGEEANGPKGAVRLFFDGRIYEAPFHIQATTGNTGGDKDKVAASPHWFVVDVPALAGLRQAVNH